MRMQTCPCACRHAQRLKEYGIKLGARTTGSRSPSRTPRGTEVRIVHHISSPGDARLAAALCATVS